MVNTEIQCPICLADVGKSPQRAAYPFVQSFGSQQSWFEEIIFCPSCGLGMASPHIDEKDLEVYYQQGSFWQDCSATQTLRNPLPAFALAQSRWEVVAKALDKSQKESISVADIGAGYGLMGILAQKRRDIKVDSYIYIDPDPAMQRFIRNYWQRSNYQSKLLVLPSISDVKENVDMIIMSHVLEHIKDPVAFVKEAVSKLKPKGILFIDLPNEDYLFKKNVFPHMMFFHHNSLRQLLHHDQRLQVEEINGYGLPREKSPLYHTISIRQKLIYLVYRFTALFLPASWGTRLFMHYYGANKVYNNGPWLRAIARKK